MNKSNEQLQQEIEELMGRARDGELDFTTCMSKIARKLLDQDGCDILLHTFIANLLACEATLPLGIITHMLVLKIVRLEDDVRVLRAEFAKERIERNQAQS